LGHPRSCGTEVQAASTDDAIADHGRSTQPGQRRQPE
jgi:hypothetical protein